MNSEIVIWIMVGFIAGCIFSMALALAPRKKKYGGKGTDIAVNTESRTSQMNAQTWVPVNVEGVILYRLEVDNRG